MPPRLLIRAQPLGGTYVPLGTGLRRGVRVEGFQCSADEWGPLAASWTLRRTSRTAWPDLAWLTPIEVEIGNQLLWSGRIVSAPGKDDASSDEIQVNAQGWQSHLDDRPFTKMFVHTSMSDWQDAHSLVGSTLAPAANGYMAGAQVSSGDGAITLTFPNGLVTLSGNRCAAVLDLGPINTAKRVVVSYTLSANDANVFLYCLGSDVQDTVSVAAETGFATALSGAGGTTAATFTTSRRYVHLALISISNHTAAAEVTAKITSVQVFSSTAYESGNASILKSSDVVMDAFARLPLITQAAIASTSFPLPAFSVDQQTPRDATNQANAFQDWQTRVNAARVLEYFARPTSAALSLNDKTAFDDLSAGSGDTVYSEATYVGTGPDGTPVVVTRTTTDAGLPQTMPSRRGGQRGATISSSAPLTSAAASQLVDVFLSQRNRTPFKGTIHASSNRAIGILPSGAHCPPSHLLRMPGELCTFPQLQDPDTGMLGRDGRIASVNYTHATDSADVDIDSTAGRYEALMSRLAVVTTR